MAKAVKATRFSALLDSSGNGSGWHFISVSREIGERFPALDGKSRRVVCTLNGKEQFQCALMPSGGRLSVTSRDSDNGHHPPTANRSSQVIVEIADSGVGMDEEALRKIFEPYFSTGTGLGLTMAPFFDLVFGGDAFERKKPDPMPVLKTCEALGAAPADTLVVGDSGNDAAAARAAGCPVVLVTYGYNHGEPVRAVEADGYLDSLAELGALLAR